MTLPQLDQSFAHPDLLWALLVLPALAVLRFVGARLARRRLDRLGRRETVLTLLPDRRPWRRRFAALAFSLGMSLLVVAAAGPRGGPAGESGAADGRDIFVV